MTLCLTRSGSAAAEVARAGLPICAMRMVLTFDTASPRYEWRMQSRFVARGRLLGSQSLEYGVYRVK
jgi:hypothetical protein